MRIVIHAAIVQLVCFIFLAGFSATCCSQPQEREARRKEASQALDPLKVTRDAIVIDAHADTPLRIAAGADICRKSEQGHVDFPRMKEGGVTAEIFSIFVSPKKTGPPFENAVNLINALQHNLESCPDEAELARTARDIERLKGQGKSAALMGVEGGHAMAGDLQNLQKFYDLGVRYMTLTWMNSNEFADSSGDAARWNGLNDLGVKVVAEMNRLGMIIDISHVSDQTFWQVMKLTTRPVIASHSCCRALCDIPRNMSDDMLRGVARNGGVVCVNFYPGFLSALWKQPGEGKTEPEPETGTVHLSSLVDHIDHVIRVAGIDHVGLGSDFDGIEALPAGLRDVRDIPKITALLLQKGYSPDDVKKVLGGNLLRVIREVVGE